MAVKVVHVSDISGKEADEHSLGRLVIHEHPEYADLPVSLEVLPHEVDALKGSSRYVTLEWIEPGAKRGERMTVGIEDFNLLAEPGAMDNAIQEALIAKHQKSREKAQPAAARTGGRTRINYASLEHAGEPHRGRITEAEKEIVRNNLDEVNRRLRASGFPEIDPNDPKKRERYGLK